ncbi:hypothetical protein [Bacillus taeanensis]|uniref:Uncharacterized protein n=1 Tax=Bacillus taeanensis TaxID=273032 RepID=A0A366Y4R6_9BACI|nr:hypothetical protein [Bacillus taeanensis]RBW71403.1 hypothetical protein DS031_01255 [Bacillus taeanensis]
MAAKFIVNSKSSRLNTQVLNIKLALNEIETKKKQLHFELEKIQNECPHDFNESMFIKTCSKCQYSESIYY